MDKLISLKKWMKLYFEEGSVTYPTILNWANKGSIPAQQINNRWFISSTYRPQQQISAGAARMLRNAVAA